MKYEVPEINISKFSQENIVTLSAVGKAYSAVKSELDKQGGNSVIVRTDLSSWVIGE